MKKNLTHKLFVNRNHVYSHFNKNTHKILDQINYFYALCEKKYFTFYSQRKHTSNKQFFFPETTITSFSLIRFLMTLIYESFFASSSSLYTSSLERRSKTGLTTKMFLKERERERDASRAKGTPLKSRQDNVVANKTKNRLNKCSTKMKIGKAKLRLSVTS